MKIDYTDLERVLLSVGFVPGRTDGVHQTFAHDATGLTFSLPLMTRPVRGLPTYVAALRGYLYWAGLLDLDEFDVRVHARPIITSAPLRRVKPRPVASGR